MNERLPDLDPFTVDQLLDGLATDPVVSPVLDALATPPLTIEFEGARSAAACIAAAIPATAAANVPTRGIRRLTTRTGALAAAGALAFSGVAAAATGVPVPLVQEIFENNEEPVLIEVEDLDAEIADLLDDADTGENAKLVVSDGEDESKDAEADNGEADDGDSEKAEAEKDKADKQANEAKDNHGSVVSEAAKSDCGKNNVEEQPEECDGFDNHGDFVSDAAKENNGRSNKPAESDVAEADSTETETVNGNGNSNGNGNGKAKGKSKGD